MPSEEKLTEKTARRCRQRWHEFITSKHSDNIMKCRNVDVCLLVPATVPMSRIAVLAVVVMGVSTIYKITRNAYYFVSFICTSATHTMCLATTLHTNPFPIPLQRLRSSPAGWAGGRPPVMNCLRGWIPRRTRRYLCLDGDCMRAAGEDVTSDGVQVGECGT